MNGATFEKMKTLQFLAFAVFLSGCATTTVAPDMALMEELSTVTVDLNIGDIQTLHDFVESIERQANSQLTNSRRISIVVELPRIDPPPRQENNLLRMGGFFRSSLPCAIKYVAEVSGVQYFVSDDERKIVVPPAFI